MHVRVDEARQQHPAAQVLDLGAGMGGAQVREGSAGPDASPLDQKAPVVQGVQGVPHGEGAVGRMHQGRAVERHGVLWGAAFAGEKGAGSAASRTP